MIKSKVKNYSKIPSEIEGDWNLAAQQRWIDLIALFENQTMVYEFSKEAFENLMIYCVRLQEIERESVNVAKLLQKKQITTTDIKKIYKLRGWIFNLKARHDWLELDTVIKNYKKDLALAKKSSTK